MSERIYIGSRIKYFREKKEMSRRELSLLSSVNYTTLMNIENEKTDPKINTLLKLTKFLGVSIKDLFNNDEK